MLLNTTANGRIYEWVSPISGQLQGNYEPISLLKAPNQKSMFTLGGGWKLNKYDEVRMETAFSKNGLNLFSDLDAADDKGNGLQLNLRYDGRQSGESKMIHVGRVQVSAIF